MAKRSNDELEDFDDLEFPYGPDLDIEMFDDTSVDEERAEETNLSAWQRIEMRKESDWLRSQVVDWDDWDEFFDSH